MTAAVQTDVDAAPRAAPGGWIAFWSLAVLIFAVYYPALPAPFIFDDENQITRNHEVRRLWPVTPFLDEPRPVSFFTFALNYAWSQYRPYTWRLTNVFIHLAAAWILFDLIRRALIQSRVAPPLQTQAWGIAFATAALWALHPLQTAAVSYIVQRCESLMSLCFLLALYGLLRGATGARGMPWFVLAAVAAWIGAGAKEIIVTLPLVALLFDRAVIASSWREVFRRRGWVHGTFFAAAVLAAYFLWNSTRGRASASFGFGMQSMTPWDYLKSQPAVLLRYMRLLVWPDQLVLDYGWPKSESLFAIYGLGLMVVALVAVSVWAYTKSPATGWLGLAAFLILAPTSSFIPIADLAFEHRMYLPSACLITLFVLAGYELLQRVVTGGDNRRKVAAACVALILLPLAARTYARNAEYRSAERMWRGSAEFNPRNSRALNNLGAILAKQPGREDEAVELYRRAAEAAPRSGMFPDNLGNVYARRHDYAAAVPWFERAIAAEPGYLPARLHLAQCYLLLGRDRDAFTTIQEAEEQQPGHPDVRRQKAIIMSWATDPQVADGPAAVELTARLREEGRARSKDLDFELLNARVDAYAAAGRWEDACRTIEKALPKAADPRVPRRFQPQLAARLRAFQEQRPWNAARELEFQQTLQANPPAAGDE